MSLHEGKHQFEVGNYMNTLANKSLDIFHKFSMFTQAIPITTCARRLIKCVYDVYSEPTVFGMYILGKLNSRKY